MRARRGGVHRETQHMGLSKNPHPQVHDLQGRFQRVTKAGNVGA